MIDCIAGYHLNPWTCGIAKFNMLLARHLGLPVVGIGSEDLAAHQQPLLSLKLSEFTPADVCALDQWVSVHVGRFELFLHAFDGTAAESRLLRRPRAFTAAIASCLAPCRRPVRTSSSCSVRGRC